MGDRGTYIPDAAERTATESERAAVLMKREVAAREWDDEIARNHAALLERIKAPHGLIEELVERFDCDRNGDDDPVLLAAKEYLANPPTDARQIVKALLDTLPPSWTDEKAKALKDAQAFVDGVAAPVGDGPRKIIRALVEASEPLRKWAEVPLRREQTERSVIYAETPSPVEDACTAFDAAVTTARTYLGESA